jgi:hypothetical protein
LVVERSDINILNVPIEKETDKKLTFLKHKGEIRCRVQINVGQKLLLVYVEVTQRYPLGEAW